MWTRETRAGRGGAGDSVGEATLQFVHPTPPAPPFPPGAVAALLRLFGFGQRFQTSSLWFLSGGNAETLVEAAGEAAGISAGMSAGDPNSALNFKCHCTKSGDTGWGVNWPSH